VSRKRLLTLLFAVVAAAALALAGTSPAQPGTGGLLLTAADAIEGPTIDLINQVRTEHGLRPLKVSVRLNEAAETHSVSMATEGYFDHTSSDGTVFWKRIARYFGQAGFRRWTVGENLLWASPDVSPQQAVDMWLASPGHRKVLLSPAWTQIGLAAVHVRNAPGIFEGYDVTIVTADFGARS
jgi:uncharacterized protein YkwD